jgi:hypothetical protein
VGTRQEVPRGSASLNQAPVATCCLQVLARALAHCLRVREVPGTRPGSRDECPGCRHVTESRTMTGLSSVSADCCCCLGLLGVAPSPCAARWSVPPSLSARKRGERGIEPLARPSEPALCSRSPRPPSSSSSDEDTRGFTRLRRMPGEFPPISQCRACVGEKIGRHEPIATNHETIGE